MQSDLTNYTLSGLDVVRDTGIIGDAFAIKR